MVLILNGAGSSGKSTISQLLLHMIDEPVVYHNFDFLVPALLPHRDSFLPAADKGDRSYERKLDKALYGKMNKNGKTLLPLIYEFIATLHIRQIGLHRVCSGCDFDNLASKRVMAKAGMQFESNWR